MHWTPLLAQTIDLPPNVSDLGAAGILSVALFGVMIWVVRPLMASYIATQKERVDAQRQWVEIQTRLLTHLRESDVVIDRNSDEIRRYSDAQEHSAAETHEMRLAITALATAQTELVRALPDTVANIVKANADTAARLDAHDTQAREGIARIEATLAGLRDEILSGHKSQRAEVLGKLEEVLTEIRALRPPPLPPLPTPALTLVPDKAADDGEEKAA